MVLRGITIMLAAVLIIWSFSENSVLSGGEGFGITQGAILFIGVLLLIAAFMKVAWTSAILTLFLSTAVAIVIAELVLRSFLAPKYFGVFEFDSNYLYKLIPNTERAYQHQDINGGENIRYHINSQGFRGQELSDSGSQQRIVVYGDSFIQAEFSARENTFSEQLERQLEQQFSEGFEVINAGVAGYGPDQILRKMKEQLPWLKPDLVIVAIFAGNDYGDLLRNKMYRLDQRGELQDNTFTLSDEIFRRLELTRSEPILKKMLRPLLRREKAVASDITTQTGHQRVETYLQRNLNEHEQYIVNNDNVVRELASDPYNADVSLTPDSDSAIYKLKLMDHIIGNIKTVTDQYSVPLVMLLIPHPMDVLNGRHDSGIVDANKYPQYVPSRLTDELERIVDRHGIRYVNLFDLFNHANAEALYFKGGDDHWNDRGQQMAAKIMLQYFVTNRLLVDD